MKKYSQLKRQRNHVFKHILFVLLVLLIMWLPQAGNREFKPALLYIVIVGNH